MAKPPVARVKACSLAFLIPDHPRGCFSNCRFSVWFALLGEVTDSQGVGHLLYSTHLASFGIDVKAGEVGNKSRKVNYISV